MPRRVRIDDSGATPSVSVVVPSYNYGRYLPSAVASALDQPGVDVEVIIVDDASTDGESVDVARAVAASDARVTLVEHEKNMRHIATYNDGIARATGDYLVLLSADDLLAPGSLSRSARLLQAEPSVGLVYGYAELLRGDATAVGAATTQPDATWTVWSGAEWIKRMCRRGRNVIRNPEAIMRRDLINELGGYDPDLPLSADMYMWLRAAARADIGRVNGPVQAYYRIHDSNMHDVDFGGLLDDSREVLATFDRFIVAEEANLARPRALSRTARRQVAREVLRRSALLTGSEREHVTELREFARNASPTDWVARLAYGPGMERALLPLLRQEAELQWKIRYHRELRWGT